MSRLARQYSSTGIYHIVFRGVNHCHLFEEPADYERLLESLGAVKSDLGLCIFAYCLLSNHAHLLVKERSTGEVTLAMEKLLGPYAYWFNKKYQRSGALIAGRFKSKGVEDDAYLLTLVRYIHQNPLVAGLARNLDDYRWSSYRDYAKVRQGLTDTEFILGLFSDVQASALREFISFHEVLETKDLSDPARRKKSEEEVYEGIASLLGKTKPNALSGLPIEERNANLALLRSQGYSIRQIERATGISRGIVLRAREVKP